MNSNFNQFLAKIEYLDQELSFIHHELSNSLTMVLNRATRAQDNLSAQQNSSAALSELSKIASSAQKIQILLETYRSFLRFHKLNSKREIRQQSHDEIENLLKEYFSYLTHRAAKINVIIETQIDLNEPPSSSTPVDAILLSLKYLIEDALFSKQGTHVFRVSIVLANKSDNRTHLSLTWRGPDGKIVSPPREQALREIAAFFQDQVSLSLDSENRCQIEFNS
jgi:hypothetical protein